jgi:hypothetical protein
MLMEWDYVSELQPPRAYCSSPLYMSIENHGGMILTGNQRTWTCPSATSSTINPTWTDPDANPGLRSARPATNRLSHGTARYKSCFLMRRVVGIWEQTHEDIQGVE